MARGLDNQSAITFDNIVCFLKKKKREANIKKLKKKKNEVQIPLTESFIHFETIKEGKVMIHFKTQNNS